MRLIFVAVASLYASVSALAQQPAPAQSPAPPSRQTAAGAIAPADPARAPAPPYRVELLVFRATSALGAPEDWSVEAGGQTQGTSAEDADSAAGAPSASPAPPASPAPSAAFAASPPPADRLSDVHVLPPSDFQLDRIAERLRTSGRYVPVAHVAWSQTASPWGRPIEIPIESLGVEAKGLTGSVALERGEFLHLALSLDYAMDDPPPGLDAAPGTVFVLRDSHRVRFDERNYFDHPAFGAIALVTPVRRIEPRAARAPGGAQPLRPSPRRSGPLTP
jgi:hypothetical protein